MEDEPIAVEDHISRDSSSVTLSQPGKESTLIQELNSEKSKNQALDLQLQNQIHLIQKFVSLYHSDDSSGSPKEEFNNILQQLTELKETLPKHYSSTWSYHLPNSSKPSSFQDFQCQVDPANSKMSSGSDNNDRLTQIDKITKEKEQHKAKVEELLALSKQKEDEGSELAALLDAKSSELQEANDELVKLQELWEVEKADLCSKIEEMSKNENGHSEELKKLKQANTKLSEEKSKLSNSLKEQEKKSHSKEKSLSDKNNNFQNTIKELQNSLKELKQKLSKLQDSFKELKQKFFETEKGLSEEKLRDSIKKLRRRENSNGTKSNAVPKETASIMTSASDGGQSEQNDRPLFSEETLSQRIEELESDLAQKQEYELEVLAEKYEHDLDISQGITEDTENYERELDQKYTLKSQAVDEQGMSFFETSADKELVQSLYRKYKPRYSMQRSGANARPGQSFESPEFHNVGPMAHTSDNRGAQSAAQDVPDAHPPEQNLQDRLPDEPIAVEDHISRDSSSVTLSQPGKESTLIQELNSEKSKNQALDLQLQNQIHLIQKLKSEKDTLSLSLQKKDKDIQVLSEKLQDRLPQGCATPLPAALMLGPPASGYTASGSSSTTSGSSRLTSNSSA